VDRFTFAVIAAGLLSIYAVGWLAWRLGIRSAAVALGFIPLTAYDYRVKAWKAERRAKWADALTAYGEALRLDPGEEEVCARISALLEQLRTTSEIIEDVSDSPHSQDERGSN
jgi:hypothetical protein